MCCPLSTLRVVRSRLHTHLSVKETLLECLKNKFKKERHPLSGINEIQSVRQKYSHPGSGRKRSELQEQNEPLPRKVHKVSVVELFSADTCVFH